MFQLAIIIPACNEELHLPACIQSLVEQQGPSLSGIQVLIVVAANGCTDRTVSVAETYRAVAESRGWRLDVLNLPVGDKLAALNAAEAAFPESVARLYVDADVVCGAGLLSEVAAVLMRPEPVYVAARLRIAPARSWVTTAYAEVWKRMPFVRSGAIGVGLFGMNAAGRERWGKWPGIISDDTFARLHFRPEERVEVAAEYAWPMVEGWRALVRTRGRQDAGVRQLRLTHGHLFTNESHGRPSMAETVGIMVTRPIALAVYLGVALTIRATGADRRSDWFRGR